MRSTELFHAVPSHIQTYARLVSKWLTGFCIESIAKKQVCRSILLAVFIECMTQLGFIVGRNGLHNILHTLRKILGPVFFGDYAPATEHKVRV